MNTNRIPDFPINTPDDMLFRFAEMSKRDLLFHPDGSPNNILNIVTSEPVFSSSECENSEDILSGIFTRFGDKAYDAAYPIFLKRMDTQLDA